MTTDTETRADAYLAEVRRHLGSLTDDERDDLLDDLTAHVHQVAADDDRPLEESLGPPEAFADELLASAGLSTEPRAPKPGLVARVRGWIEAAVEAVRRQPAGRAVLDFLPELRPAWWVLRAWLLVYLVTVAVTGDGATDSFPFPEVFGSWVLGAMVVAVAAVVSVRLGRRRPPIRGRWVVNGAAIVAGVVLVGAVNDSHVYYVDQGDTGEVFVDQTFIREPGLRHSDGAPITNIYAYDANGQPLDRVRLYDQSGRPIEVYPGHDTNGLPLVTEPVTGADGLDVTNAYPLHQSTAGRFPGDPLGDQPVGPPPLVVAPLPAAGTVTTSTTVPAPAPGATTTVPAPVP
jgi:hypothetical protein